MHSTTLHVNFLFFSFILYYYISISHFSFLFNRIEMSIELPDLVPFSARSSSVEAAPGTVLV